MTYQTAKLLICVADAKMDFADTLRKTHVTKAGKDVAEAAALQEAAPTKAEAEGYPVRAASRGRPIR